MEGRKRETTYLAMILPASNLARRARAPTLLRAGVGCADLQSQQGLTEFNGTRNEMDRDRIGGDRWPHRDRSSHRLCDQLTENGQSLRFPGSATGGTQRFGIDRQRKAL